MNFSNRASWLLIITLAIVKFMLPYLLQHPVYELHRDELLYLEQGHHLALGYMEVPPMLSWLAWLTHFLGGSFFWVKFWPSLFGAFTLLLTCRMAREMGGGLFAILLAGLGIIFTAYLRTSFLFQANFLEIFWWTLSAYFIVRFIKTEKNIYLYLLGFSLGLSWLAKNAVLFFATGIFVAMLVTRYRKQFLNKHLYGAALLAILIALPNLVWQYQHNWPLLHHMNELRETQLKFLNPVDFLLDQILMFFAAFFVWMAGLAWLFTKTGKQYRMLGWIYLAVVAVLIIFSGKSYYTLGAYPMLFAAGGIAWQQWTANRLRWLRWFAIALVLFLAWIVLPIALPLWPPQQAAAFYKEQKLEKTGILKWEDQQNHSLPQDFADYLGWKEMTEKAESFYNQLTKDQQAGTIIYCRHYGQAGALKYYGKQATFREKVFSDNASFLQWIPADISFNNLIFIGRRIPGYDDEVFQHFREMIIVDSVTNTHSRQRGDKIIFYKNIDSAGLTLARDGIKAMKQRFNR